ncbi:SpoIIE family protein phosphatase [Granulicella sp. dw_53]|uniref:SpoIIE family protein phosphatase n=1 Tax=Granulicella sp. dw_53 TaxID=2719792 RepID=UPI0021065507|nr:SpoIIE family protein phosphatase [Granulicella sp. dw_53]
MTTQTLTQKTIDAKSGWRPPTGMAGAAFWLTVWFCLLWFLRLIPGMFGSFFSGLQILVGFALIGVTVPLLLRLVRRHMLWSLRNKLVLTYLLIGLAPVILFVTLVTISGYVAAGQFAIHLADTRLQAELSQMADENANRTRGFAQYMDSHGLAIPQLAPQDSRARGGLVELDDPGRTRLKRETTAFLNGVPLSLEGAPVEMETQRGKTPFGLPPWAAQLPGAEFHGLVLDGGELYLVAVHQHRLSDGHVFSMMSSLPVDGTVMDLIANGLGRTGLLAGRAGTSSNSPVYGEGRRARGQARKGESAWISGGNAPRGLNLADIRVRFLSTVSMTDWDTGESGDIPIEVTSRPSLLYRQLFGTSLGGIVTSVIRTALIALCVVFLLIELLALVLAIRLSKTITASVADLYEATLRIDRGELNHRIGVEREDQLAELSRSFNRMTGSLQRLLVEQQEKEQMQNELSIAQEVQANLFPRQDCDLPTLQLHGVCRPARTVSGDYYDFLVFHEEAHDGHAAGRETGVGIALGDISGKGISAALLMATLHSAVRAYRFASEELVYSESHVAGLTASREGRGGECDELFQSPGRILSLLNRHLYRSTQPEKYATLFLAHYDAKSSLLTYSNAGQLPPLVLGRDGAIRRLDKGGTVVGLMDGMSYEEDRFKMELGDILVAYSDGVTEPENDFGDFGEERLMEVVHRYRDEPLHVISSQVMQALDAWIGAEEQPDDITLVLARQR